MSHVVRTRKVALSSVTLREHSIGRESVMWLELDSVKVRLAQSGLNGDGGLDYFMCGKYID